MPISTHIPIVTEDNSNRAHLHLSNDIIDTLDEKSQAISNILVLDSSNLYIKPSKELVELEKLSNLISECLCLSVEKKLNDSDKFFFISNNNNYVEIDNSRLNESGYVLYKFKELSPNTESSRDNFLRFSLEFNLLNRNENALINDLIDYDPTFKLFYDNYVFLKKNNGSNFSLSILKDDMFVRFKK